MNFYPEMHTGLTMQSALHADVYESQQNLGQGLGAGKACLGSKSFVADCSNVVFLLWFIFIG